MAFVYLPLPRTPRVRLALIDARRRAAGTAAAGAVHVSGLSGVSEQQPRAGRRDAVRAMLRVLEDLGPLAKDVSEVNVADTETCAIVAQVEGRAMELDLGDGNFAARFQNFLNHYPEIQKRSPGVTARSTCGWTISITTKE